MVSGAILAYNHRRERHGRHGKGLRKSMDPSRRFWKFWKLLLVFLAVLSSEGITAAADGDDGAIPPERRAEDKDHWAWKAPSRPPVPAVKDPGRVKNPIDAFILAKVDEAGLEPAPPAPREQLLRRITLDLTGLPPTPEETDAFLGDGSPNAWEAVI